MGSMGMSSVLAAALAMVWASLQQELEKVQSAQAMELLTTMMAECVDYWRVTQK
eukprot:gene7389-5319_t